MAVLVKGRHHQWHGLLLVFPEGHGGSPDVFGFPLVFLLLRLGEVDIDHALYEPGDGLPIAFRLELRAQMLEAREVVVVVYVHLAQSFFGLRFLVGW